MDGRRGGRVSPPQHPQAPQQRPPRPLHQWATVERALAHQLNSLDDFEQICQMLGHREGITGLRAYFDGESVCTKDRFIELLRQMKESLLQWETRFRQQCTFLPIGSTGSVFLEPPAVDCLLSMAFFCAFPAGPDCQFWTRCTLGPIYQQWPTERMPLQRTKLHFLISFMLRRFERPADSPHPSRPGVLELVRVRAKDGLSWMHCSKPLPELESVPGKEAVEDTHICPVTGTPYLRVDFANKYPGGGALYQGAVQEEILFMEYPEFIVTMILCEKLDDREAIRVGGVTRYATYEGYDFRLKFPVGAFDYVDNTEFVRTDRGKMRQSAFTVIDAVDFRPPRRQPGEGLNPELQFTEQFLVRELDKAWAGFVNLGAMRVGNHKTLPTGESDPSVLLPVATGKWGCGAFLGDTELKALLQLIATAEVGRRAMRFSCFGEEALDERFKLLHKAMVRSGITGGYLYQIVLQYGQERRQHGFQSPLFDYVYRYVSRDATDLPPSLPPARQAAPAGRFQERGRR